MTIKNRLNLCYISANSAQHCRTKQYKFVIIITVFTTLKPAKPITFSLRKAGENLEIELKLKLLHLFDICRIKKIIKYIFNITAL